ncbi:Glucokinase [Frondihabitans sp. 762G35]|uniref:ROK family protein n=1 Tax=Frondihabitans sp. 762G35 TaxID=1446794 RepID=UPI000D21E79D|nr:ROK family protein [Frondihabitans sp. 762G35]ARC56262.1 Glucokinase [Frondihabitans sp. 762G35]
MTDLAHGDPGHPADTAVVAVDIGGTTIKGAAFDDRGALLDRLTVPTFGVESSAVESLAALVGRLEGAIAGGGRRLAGIGVASPGLVDPVHGRVSFAANLGWSDLPLVDILTERFGVPVALEHDGRAAARAERAARIAAGRDGDEFVFVPIGTGISAAIVTGGVVVQGATGGAGEFGHVQVVPDGELCTCGQRGCIEVYASASAIVRRYRAQGGTSTGLTREITEAVDDDPVAARVWDAAVGALATGITGLAALLDPTAIVIGGGLGEAGERLLVPLRARVAEHLGWRVPPLIEQSLVGPGAGLEGAALLLGPVARGSRAPGSTLVSPPASVPSPPKEFS